MIRVLLFSLVVVGSSGLKVVRDVLSHQEIRGLEETKVCGESNNEKSFLQLNKQVLDRLNLNVPFAENVQVQARSVSQTTSRHQDRHWGTGSVVEDDVAFVFLNSNPDAKFIHGDTEVDVQEGTFVQFRGDVPHHTSVQSGHVDLAGPFHIRSLQPVGDTIPFFAPVAPKIDNALYTALVGILLTIFAVTAVVALGYFD